MIKTTKINEKDFAVSFKKILLFSTFSLAGCQSVSDKQIEAWVEKNPDKIIAALTNFQRAQREANLPKAEQIKENADGLFSNAGSPKVGSGSIKIAYFFDFNCGHCARQSETIKAVLEKNKNVEVVYKNLPVLGPSSELAARGAIAAHQQNKFKEFYQETYKIREKTNESLKKVAKKVGLDVSKWEKDLNGEAVNAEIAHVRDLASKLKITGTPFTVIAPDKVFPGRTDQLLEIVNSIKQ